MILDLRWARPMVLGACALLFAVGVWRWLAAPAVVGVVNVVTGRQVPIYKVQTDRKAIALSFDATWGTGLTDELLEILRTHGVKTTFFLAGYWVEKHPDYVRKIAAEGHEIGNHSYAHPHLNSLEPGQIRHDLAKNHELLKSITGKDAFLFRPPYGEYSNKVIETAAALGYYTVQWSIDSLDWKNLSAEAMVERVLRLAQPGDIVLFHNAGKYTPETIRQLIPALKARGYVLVPVGELIYRDHFFIEPHSGLQRPLPGPRPSNETAPRQTEPEGAS